MHRVIQHRAQIRVTGVFMLPQRTDPKDGCNLEPCRKIDALLLMKELNTNFIQTDRENILIVSLKELKPHTFVVQKLERACLLR